MNWSRILMGGLLAGVIINVSEGILNAGILMDEYEAIMAQYGLTEASWAMVGYVLSSFVFGIVLAWLYAAVRPRFGPGWATAAKVGFAVWAVAYAMPTVWFSAMGLTLSAGSTMLAVVWGLVELMLAAAAAGWVYRESGAAESMSAPPPAATPAI